MVPTVEKRNQSDESRGYIFGVTAPSCGTPESFSKTLKLQPSRSMLFIVSFLQ